MAKFYIICYVIFCCDMTICRDMRFISKIFVSLHEKSHNWLINLVWVEWRAHVTRNIGLLAQISYICVSLGKAQLNNYVNAHCLQISIWTWFMLWHNDIQYIVAALHHNNSLCALMPFKWQRCKLQESLYRLVSFPCYKKLTAECLETRLSVD